MVTPGDLSFDRLKGLSPLLTFLMIAIMLFGRHPRRMTKWGAFWTYLTPFNIGIFYALLRDSPWNRRMNLLPVPQLRDRIVVDLVTGETIRRYGGWTMFFWSTIIASLAISLMLLGVARLFPTYLDPVGWSVVDATGSRLTLP
jgi:hypothetical protein